MLLDESIYSARVRFQNLVRLRIQCRHFAVRRPPQSERAKIFVNLQRSLTQNLGKLPARHPPQQIHLPQPILCHDVTLGLGQILDRSGANVRHAPSVAVHRNLLLKAGKANASLELWQRAVDKPPGQRGSKNNENPKKPENNSRESSQLHSRVK